MRQYPFPETKINKILFGAFLLAMLLLARDTLITSVILGFTKSQILMLGLVCVLGLTFLVYNRKQLKNILTDNRMLLIVVVTVLLLFPMLIKRDWQMMYFSILICLLFSVFLTYFTKYQDVAKYYVMILTALGIHSLITMYILKPMAIFGKISVPVVYNSAGYEFLNFGLSFVVNALLWNRNFGIFREPGVYQFFVILGLFLNNYAVGWKKTWHLWLVNALLAVMMLSTFAIGGFVEMGLFAVFLFFDKGYYKTKGGKLIGCLAILAVIGLGVCFVFVYNSPYFEISVFYEFYDMFLRLTTKSNSLVDRLDAIFTNAKLFLNNPLVGDTIANVLHGTNHNTSSTLILYAIFGILGGTFNVAAWVAMAWKKERCLFGNLLLLLILFMSFNTQNLVADIFFWLFPMMALVERGLPLIQLPTKKV